MTKETYPKATVLDISASVEYSDGGIISKQVLKKEVCNITLFSFVNGHVLIENSAPFDAFLQILEGEAEIRIGGQPLLLKAGRSVIMPANVSHALHATKRFKMLLTMIRG